MKNRTTLIRTPIWITSLILWSLLWTGCTQEADPLRIAISKESDAYRLWLQRNDSTVVTVDMYPLGIEGAINELQDCDGLLLTGGEDVYPGYYGKEQDTGRCGEFNHYRDSLEMALIAAADKAHLPIFGVCRGEQIINVALGGSLIIDIPVDFDTSVVHRQEEFWKCYHPVTIVSGSVMENITQSTGDSVTSNHHQGIDRLAPSLTIVAYAEDSLPEAVVRRVKGASMIMAVQWHPERMAEGHPLSDPLAKQFLNRARIHQAKKN